MELKPLFGIIGAPCAILPTFMLLHDRLGRRVANPQNGNSRPSDAIRTTKREREVGERRQRMAVDAPDIDGLDLAAAVTLDIEPDEAGRERNAKCRRWFDGAPGFHLRIPRLNSRDTTLALLCRDDLIRSRHFLADPLEVRIVVALA